jgi:hypothetical protein
MEFTMNNSTNALIKIITENTNQTSTPSFISYTLSGDGSKILNKGRGAKAMVEVLGHEVTDIVTETKNTALCGSDYQTMQNNRIEKSVKKLLTEVQLKGGDTLIEGILEGILAKFTSPEMVEDLNGNMVAEAVFKAQSLPWGSWVEGLEGILLEHTKEGEHKFYLRIYDEAKAPKKYKFFLENEEIDIDDEKFNSYRKAPKKKSGKVNELKEALSKLFDLDAEENAEIKTALENIKPISPEVLCLDNILNLRINGVEFKA